MHEGQTRARRGPDEEESQCPATHGPRCLRDETGALGLASWSAASQNRAPD